MTFSLIGDHYHSDAKFLTLSHGAVVLYWAAVSYAASQHSNGFLRRRDLDMLARQWRVRRPAIAELGAVPEGYDHPFLIVESDGLYRIHEDDRFRRKTSTERVKRFRRKRAETDSMGTREDVSGAKELLLARDGMACGWCGETLDEPMVVDHIKPVTKGGGHELANLRVLHRRCNSERYDKELLHRPGHTRRETPGETPGEAGETSPRADVRQDPNPNPNPNDSSPIAPLSAETPASRGAYGPRPGKEWQRVEKVLAQWADLTGRMPSEGDRQEARTWDREFKRLTGERQAELLAEKYRGVVAEKKAPPARLAWYRGYVLRANDAAADALEPVADDYVNQDAIDRNYERFAAAGLGFRSVGADLAAAQEFLDGD